MTQDFATLGLPELFARFAAGHAAGVTVVTPNQRLAQALLDRHDTLQRSAGRRSWEAPDVLPHGAFLARCLEEAQHEPGRDAPHLLDEEEARIVWEDAIAEVGTSVLSAAATASVAASAWDLAHAWRIAGALDRPGNEDTEAFTAWRREYLRRTAKAGFIDAPRLPAWIAASLQQPTLTQPAPFPLPRLLVLHAFDVLTPAQHDIYAAFARAGVEVRRSSPEARAGSVRRHVLASPRAELEACARWARSRLEAAAGADPVSIAVVVPDLSQRRAEVVRVFDRFLPGCYNISLGEPLAHVPLVAAALALVDLAYAAVPFDRASRLLRSPYVAGSESESSERARLDAALRRMAPATVTLPKLRAWIPEAVDQRRAPRCARLAKLLDEVIEAARGQGRAAPHEWARRFTRILAAAGFPGERTLDSGEYQALSRWRDLLAAFARLSSVAGTWSASEARARLQRLAAAAFFQPASGEAPVQVLGILESAGLAFDHLWVSGLTEEAWPLAARPHPLIPPGLQRQAGIPQASAEASLALDRGLTQRWREAANEVVFSSPALDGDRELLPSPLVADVPETAPGDAAFATRHAALFAASRVPGAITTRTDAQAPPIAAAGAPGGTAILGDQSACPFRAFAHHRLDARELDAPESGLQNTDRGQLLHLAMLHIWTALNDHATLVAASPARLEELAREAADTAVKYLRRERPGRLDGRFAQLERERLARIALEWLAIERDERAPFEVAKMETAIPLSAGSLQFRGRVDRVDRLADGGLAIIDYKSGTPRVSAWLSDRPDDAQLPLYALATGEEPVRAVAYACLRVGQLGFEGLSREPGVLPGVKTVDKHLGARKFAQDWDQLQAAWRTNVDRLAVDFASGDARIDPKRLLATCERCDLQPFCRVHERLGTLAEDLDEDEA